MIKTYGKYPAGTVLVWRENGRIIKAVVKATDYKPPKKYKDPILVCTNQNFWIDAAKLKLEIDKPLLK